MFVSKEVIARILTAFLALVENDKELYHPKDVEMVQSNDWWIERLMINFIGNPFGIEFIN